MHLLAWADHRTLIACHCLLTAVFAAGLLGLRRIYPDLRGVTFMAMGFLLGVPATALVSVPGVLASFRVILAANTFACLCYMLLYLGILRFCQSQSPPPPDKSSGPGLIRFWPRQRNEFLPFFWASAILATAVVVYSVRLRDPIVPRVLSIAFTLVLGRTLMAVTLFRYAAGRLHMALFGCSLLGFAALTLSFTIATLRVGQPYSFVDHDAIQSLTLLAGFLFLCVNGIFYVAMIGSAIARRIEQQAHLDFLTNTMNRGGIERALGTEIARTRRTRRPFSLLMIDIDRFKQINDAFGHAAGDQALRTAARDIGSVLRVYDKLGRFGGDEFLVLLPETAGDDAMLIAARMCELHQTSGSSSGSPSFTLSVGVTQCAWNEEAIEILARADNALYQAKHNGRNGAYLKLPLNPIAVLATQSNPFA